MNNVPYSHSIPFYIAEVIEISSNDEIICSVLRPGTTAYPITAQPSDINCIKTPLKGEHVLIFRGYRTDSKTNKIQPNWFYFNPITISSNVNLNSTPGISNASISGSIDVGEYFKERVVTSLRQFEGDISYQGRWGNSIRLGSTISSDANDSVTPWNGSTIGDPITIISNNHADSGVERINDSNSAIYLTSTQRLPELTLGTTQEKNSLRCFTPIESKYSKSQLIGTADRIILKAKTDIAVIDAPKAIILNTTGDVKIGSDAANISMVHGDVLVTILQKILNQLNVPMQSAHLTGTFLDKSNIQSAQRDLRKLLSSKYFIKKQTY
jgi:hypothetical protein